MLGFAYYQWIAGVGVPLLIFILGWGLKKLDEHNSHQHSEAMQARSRIEEKIDDTHKLLVDHIVWHGQHPPEARPHLEVIRK